MNETKNTGEDTGPAPATQTTPPSLEEQIRAHLRHRIEVADNLVEIASGWSVIGEHPHAHDIVSQRIAAIDAGTAQLLAELREWRNYYRKA